MSKGYMITGYHFTHILGHFLLSSDKSRYDMCVSHILTYLDWCGIWVRQYPDFTLLKNAMTRRGLITLVVSLFVCFLTPAGLYVYIVPILVGCIGGKKVWMFYFQYFFEDDKR